MVSPYLWKEFTSKSKIIYFDKIVYLHFVESIRDTGTKTQKALNREITSNDIIARNGIWNIILE